MAQGPDGKTIIIVKKVVGHGGHHGGSWKVAYADFVTSMMAFFMVLWLVNTASSPVRERIASYFRAPGVFEKGSGTPIEMGGAGILPDSFAPPAERNSQVMPNNRIYEVISPDGELREVLGDGGGESELKKGQDKQQDKKKDDSAVSELEQKEQFEKLAAELKQQIEEDAQRIEGLIGKIEVKVDQRGLHLEIMDTPKASMFSRGSAEIQSEARIQLEKITQLLVTLPNPLDIEGHTDATPFRSGRVGYDNWSLSTDRANEARKALIAAGMKESQVARVVGYAAQRPKLKDDPTAATNRRISISMRFTEMAAKTLQGTAVRETKSKPISRQEAVPAPKAEEQSQGTGSQNQQQSEAKKEEAPRNELNVEMITSQPEPAEVTEIKETISSRPVWMEKDKIFGDYNPFQ
jgi:chemotaxis protein MotB